MPDLFAGCIVEGQGEETAVPIVLRRFVEERFNYRIRLVVPRPFRVHRHQIVRMRDGVAVVDRYELNRAAEQVSRRLETPGILCVILDADEDCPATIAPAVLSELASSHGHIPHAVVFPKCEFEAWFIAAAESLRGYRGLPNDLVAAVDPETILTAKEWFSERMGRPYAPTVDQQKFASRFDISLARTAPSFDKLCRDVERLVQASLPDL
jgi:hypothetical protein